MALNFLFIRLKGDKVLLCLQTAWYSFETLSKFRTKHYFDLWVNNEHYYMAVSQGLGTTEFTNLIGWNRYWKRSRFSHLDRHLDRLHFAEKKLQTKMQNYWLFSSNNIYLWRCQKAWWEQSKRTSKLWQNYFKFSSSPFANKLSASTNQLH